MKTFHHLVSRAIDEMLETERQDLRRAPGGAEYALGKASLRIVVTRKTIVGITSNRTAQRAIRELGALRLLRPTKSRPRERRGRGRPSDCYEFVLEPNKRLYRALLEAFLRRSMVRPVVDQIADGAPRIHYAEDETAFLEYPLRGFGLGRSKSVRTFRREAMRMLRKRIKEQKVFRDAGFGIGDFIRSWIQARDDALDEASAATGWLVALGVVPASAFVVAPILFPLRQLDYGRLSKASSMVRNSRTGERPERPIY